MVNTFILFFVCLWRLFGVTDAVKTISAMEGDSVTLNPDLTEIQKYLLIQWRFGSTRIAEVSRLTHTNSIYAGPDERFTGRLRMDQTGSLSITNTRRSDSGLYQLTLIGKDTGYMSFNLTVNESPPQSTSSPERSSSTQFLSSSSAVNNVTVNRTEDANITDLHQPCSEHIHCCGFNETVIRLALSALVGVAAVAFLVYDVRTTRSELIRTEETRFHRQAHGVKSGRRCETSRRLSSRYVC